MTIIEQIRAEIERRYKEFDGKTGDIATASRLAYIDVLSFLDTLQQPKFDLDKLREVAVPLSDEEKEAHRKLMDERRKKYEEMGMLQEPKVDLEKEIKAWILHECGPSDFNPYADHWCADDIMETARHFYELGCRRTAEKADEIEYNRQRAEESEKPIEGFEEELDKWRHEHFHGKRDDHFSGEYLERTSQLDLARHFAQWGAEHLKK